MSNLLLNEPPLVISPSLALAIGLNEAIILQQVHYWLQTSKHVFEGHKWIYNTYPEWQKQFPFWSEATVKRTIMNLEERGLLISGNFNKMPLDRTKWYRIDYEAIDKICLPIVSNCTDGEVKMTRPSAQDDPTLPETTTETPSDSLPRDFLGDVLAHAQKPKIQAGIGDPSQDIELYWQYKNEAVKIYVDKSGKVPPPANKEAIEAMVKDGFDSALWGDVITAYIGNGWNPSNVNGMIEYYERGEVPPPTAKGRNGNGGKSNGSHSGRVPQRNPEYKVAKASDFDPIVGDGANPGAT